MVIELSQMVRGQHPTQGAAPDYAIGAGGSFGHLNELPNLAPAPMSANWPQPHLIQVKRRRLVSVRL
jgi:hypothetical protein